MNEIEQLKEDLIARYNMSWDDAHVIDNTGIIQAAKNNFRQLVDNLITKVKQSNERTK